MPDDPTAIPPNFRPDAFRGLVDDYVSYRVPYPATMLEEMLAGAALPVAPRLLDLCCGPGRLTLAIATHFAEVTAVDLEPEMIAAGEAAAAKARLGHIRWSVGRVEELDAPAAHFDLVTCAEAFHRLDQPRVAALVRSWLKSGGAFATLGYSDFTRGETPWRQVLADVVRRWIGRPAQRLIGSPDPAPPEAMADHLATIAGAGFTDIDNRDFEVPYEWTLEALLGNLRSTSVLSRRALGDRQAAFEAELTAALLAAEPTGRFTETLRCGLTLARAP